MQNLFETMTIFRIFAIILEIFYEIGILTGNTLTAVIFAYVVNRMVGGVTDSYGGQRVKIVSASNNNKSTINMQIS